MEYSGVIYADPGDSMRVDYTPDIVFAKRPTRDLTLQLLLPFRAKPDPANMPPGEMEKQQKLAKALHRDGPPPRDMQHEKAPLIIYVPGSGWRSVDLIHMLGQFIPMVYKGYAVALVEYRGTDRDNVRYPASVQDIKEAIRFLRANADKYDIDPNRFALVGDSSGGHDVAAAVLTDGDPVYDIGENLDVSAKVQALALLWAPVDITNLMPERIAENMPLRPEDGEYPTEAYEMYKDDFLTDPEKLLAEASPINYISADRDIPPTIMFIGDRDEIVPQAQTLRFCQKMRDAGKSVELFKIAGGKHGPGCWPKAAYDVIGSFFGAYV